MFGAGEGLTKVSTKNLTTALRMVVRGEIPTPIDVIGLARVGLQHCSEPILGAVRGLDKRATISLLICVIAERRAQ